MKLEKHLIELKSELTNREEQKEQAYKNLLELKGKPEYGTYGRMNNIYRGKWLTAWWNGTKKNKNNGGIVTIS